MGNLHFVHSQTKFCNFVRSYMYVYILPKEKKSVSIRLKNIVRLFVENSLQLMQVNYYVSFVILKLTMKKINIT